MLNTSMGVHTFSFYQRLEATVYFELIGDFDKYMNDSGALKQRPIKDGKKTVGKEYTYKKQKGIRWILRSTEINFPYHVYRLQAVVTPKVLIEKNYIMLANETDFDTVKELFDSEASKISPKIRKFCRCSVNRSDIGVTFDTEELELTCSSKQLMKLFARGDIPKRFKKWMEYDDKHRPKKSNKDSIYLTNGSVVINIYGKYQQQNTKHPNYQNRESSKNVIRFEVQCKHHKLYSLSKDFKGNSRCVVNYDELTEKELWELIEKGILNPTVPVDMAFSDSITKAVVRKYFHKVVRDGDYLTLDCARWMVRGHNFRRDKEDRLIFALEQVNEHRGIAKAKSKLLGIDLEEFKRSLNDLDDIGINPVTIPRGWGIDRIRNPLRAYFEHSMEERFTTSREIVFEKLFAKYCSVA